VFDTRFVIDVAAGKPSLKPYPKIAFLVPPGGGVIDRPPLNVSPPEKIISAIINHPLKYLA